VLDRYIAEINMLVDTYGAAAFVLEARVNVEFRPGGQSYLEGAVRFADRSVLHFREYLDETADVLEKLMYVYHYQTDAGVLMFRYDNARHRPPLSFEEHRHTPSGIEFSSAPTLEMVLQEASRLGGWL
jgi:hypothetical protein